MSDMKVKILIEDADGRTRKATLSFKDDGEKKPKPKEKPLIVRLQQMDFTVRKGLPLLEPCMIGEIHLERQDERRDRCHACNEKTWSLMEVIEDPVNNPDPDYPFIDVDHDLIGEVCFDCGHIRTNGDKVGTGVFGLIDDEVHENLQAFLDEIEAKTPSAHVRTHLLRALLRQEKTHMKAVYRIRQKVAQMRIEKHEATIMSLTSPEDQENGK